METNRIKVRLGADEFDAEGPTEVVQAQFDAFLAARASMPQQAAPIAQKPEIPDTNPSDRMTPAVLDRIFLQGDTLSLGALPAGDNAEADAMLLLLYGYRQLLDETHVTGTALMKSAKMSGVNIDRVDRSMAVLQPNFVLAAGVKKARRYQLNNRGLARAEEIIAGIVQ